MNFLKDPQYNSLKMVLLLVVVFGVGYFAVTKGGDRSLDQSAKTINADMEELNAEFGEVAGLPYDAGDYIVVEPISKDFEISVPADAPGEGDVATFTGVFEVTAYGGNAYIDGSCRENAANIAGQGVEYSMLHKNKNTTTCTLTSTADTVGAGATLRYNVDEDTPEQFTLTVVATATNDHTTQLLLNSINWTTDSTDTTPDFFFNEGFGPGTEYVTPVVTLNFF